MELRLAPQHGEGVAIATCSAGLAVAILGAAQQGDLFSGFLAASALCVPYASYWLFTRLAKRHKTPVRLFVANAISSILLLATTAWLYWALFVRVPSSSTDSLIAIPVLAVQAVLLAPLGMLITSNE